MASVFQIYWPAPVDWREECNWAGKDITVSLSLIIASLLDLRRHSEQPLTSPLRGKRAGDTLEQAYDSGFTWRQTFSDKDAYVFADCWLTAVFTQ